MTTFRNGTWPEKESLGLRICQWTFSKLKYKEGKKNEKGKESPGTAAISNITYTTASETAF